METQPRGSKHAATTPPQAPHLLLLMPLQLVPLPHVLQRQLRHLVHLPPQLVQLVRHPHQPQLKLMRLPHLQLLHIAQPPRQWRCGGAARLLLLLRGPWRRWPLQHLVHLAGLQAIGE